LRLPLQDYTLVIELNPEYDSAYASRARLKKNVLKDDGGAILDYDRAIELNPSNDRYYIERGEGNCDR
jgi:hypothetical protein